MTLTEAHLKRFVDQRYLERGHAYFERGQVVLESVTDREAQASCVGGQVYAVRLTLSRSKLGGHCTCLLYTSPSPRDLSTSRMPSSA